MSDLASELRDAVSDAAGRGTALRISGGGSKAFYGRAPRGEPLSVAAHRGIVEYEPSELVITVRAGTPLVEIEAALAERGQMLGFEPPQFAATATLGGTIACGLSGPRRPYAGAARDFVLGVKLLNGKGEVLSFGGRVMKNVAGYDVSRLMVGALGTLGVLLEISLKVLPQPAAQLTLAREADATEALRAMNEWAARSLPLSACCHDGVRLFVRISGAASAVRAAQGRLGGEPVADATHFWESVREHRHGFFAGAAPLWRVAVPPAAPSLDLPGKWFIDWGGAQRWLRSTAAATTIRAAAERAGGHATLFRGGDRAGAVFHPLAASLATLHERLKRAFDPAGILNPGRLYPEL